MQDDPILASKRTRIRIILAEVKTSQCNLNGPWTNSSKKNMQRVVRAVGAFHLEMMEEVADSLYQRGVYRDSLYIMSLFCIGSRCNEQIESQFPEAKCSLGGWLTSDLS